jgi:hypothetical protein
MATDSIYCAHNRLGDSCEDCAYDAAVAAGRQVGGPKPADRPTEAVTRTQVPVEEGHAPLLSSSAGGEGRPPSR